MGRSGEVAEHGSLSPVGSPHVQFPDDVAGTGAVVELRGGFQIPLVRIHVDGQGPVDADGVIDLMWLHPLMLT